MAKPWIQNVKDKGELTVFNGAGAWQAIVAAAMVSFNKQGFGVSLKSTKEKETANVVVSLSGGSSSFDFMDKKWPVVFDAAKYHGKTLVFVDPDQGVVIKAAVFLPNKLEKVSNDVKKVVTVHEFIHAAGMNENSDHDKYSGIFYGKFNEQGGKLIEIIMTKGAKPMPPIRVGPDTLSAVRALWS